MFLNKFYKSTSNGDAGYRETRAVCKWLHTRSSRHRPWRHSCHCTGAPWLCIQEERRYLPLKPQRRHLFLRSRSTWCPWQPHWQRSHSNLWEVPVVDSAGIFHRQGRTWVFHSQLGGDISNHRVALRKRIRKQESGLCTRCGMLALCRRYHILGKHPSRSASLGSGLRTQACHT